MNAEQLFKLDASEWKPKSVKPELERDIVLKCYDWSPYLCYGRFKMVGVQKRRPGSGKSLFRTKNETGEYINANKDWLNAEGWRYCEKASDEVNREKT